METKIVQKEIIVPMDEKKSHEIRSEIISLQSELMKINNKIQLLFNELTNGEMKKTIQVIEEQNGNKILGWYDGNIIYERFIEDNDIQIELPISVQNQEEQEIAEGPVFEIDSFEPESLV